MKSITKTILSTAALLAAASSAEAVSVSATNDGLSLVNALLTADSGISIESGSVGVVGLSTQSGVFTGFNFAGNGTASAPPLLLGNGIVLTSGDAAVPNTNTYSDYSAFTNTGSSAIITQITALPSFDKNSLTFSFTTATGKKSVAAQFVYASEEYPEFAATQYADGLALVVDGVNYAKFQDGSPVSLLTLNSNNNLLDNTVSPFPYGIEYDGITPTLTITALLDPNRTIHTIEIVVADTGDDALDSAVFLSGLHASDVGDGGITPGVPEPSTWLLMSAGLFGLCFRRRAKRSTE